MASNSHGHSHATGHRAADRRRLAWTLVLVALYAGAEVAGGLATNSLALLADAGHMVSDAAALGLALFALWMAGKPGSAQHTYGYRRVEILAALANGAALLAVAVFIVVEAIGRFRQPPEVEAPLMMAIAAGGLLVNGVALAVLHGGRDSSLNLRGAWLHVAGDALGSVQALVAGGLIWAFDWRLADPIVSVLISLLVVWSGWKLLAETLSVLMEQAPRHIDVKRVEEAIAGVPGVREVHDLHVWTITSGMEAMSVHVVAPDREASPLLRDIRASMHSGFGIDHVTVQVEDDELGPCDPCC
jgi:cobalt-zinc-cadmium efflux system protein